MLSPHQPTGNILTASGFRGGPAGYITLPRAVPKDEGAYFVDQNTAQIPRFPFEPLFRATISMNPSFRFDDVDILVNRNSLRRLLDFCARRRQDSFRIDLHLVHRTLVIERCEKNARELIKGSQNPGWGRNFEYTFTRYPPGLEDSTAHHRALRYQLGGLVCVVRFEVDACYEKGTEEDGSSKSVNIQMGAPSMSDGLVNSVSLIEPSAQRPMAQAMAAEIKTASKPRSMGTYLPQVWFGRTPWLIIGRHTGRTFEELKTHFEAWEGKQQNDLRRLVTVLSQWRGAVEQNGGSHCVAVCEKNEFPPLIRVFPSMVTKKAIPDELRHKLWDFKTNNLSTH
ncbi:hypothetical protein CLIM01_14274 [Colletotrichum limetticola]|uniref:Geranylgeranyl pyrophosphate synthetase n=1 Tax=Colletotrichum limetticola TaxID=1209924 RepID=A0ABQ9PB56_9PEZI|nr:hypothetical protein CLIM01_14274 [Colletotrichum limetticola]